MRLPVVLVATSGWPSRFPTGYRGLALVGIGAKVMVVPSYTGEAGRMEREVRC